MILIDYPWPELPCYLLLDGVRKPKLKRWIYENEENPKCISLYLETKYHDILSCSPELVQTELYSELWLSYMDKGVLDHWGLTLFSDESFTDVLNHCRWWLQVQTQAGTMALFRLYDPSLSWRLFAASTSEQLSYLFGPINEIHCYSDQWHQFYNSAPVIGDYSQPVRLADNQWQAISDSKYASFLKRLKSHTLQFFPHLLEGKNIQQQQDWLETLVQKANSHQFNTVQDIYFFTNVIGYLGRDAMNPSIHPEIHQLITQSSELTPSQRIELAAVKAQQFVVSRKSHG
ncbi:DUF4123 domain-containing protein [Spartinivicinus poritis]|uniref:DUF4123 domain-containing protein n=1 Tax=Spartinivicinus poritis TaxID=2994640 RepID=A0ABT5UES8_9GAMM|nr:DUF4123 domain-containing protein [Spartinivicinus sp. A2-2]MDE1464491.1 DUF4123 domain-containing protein [Spartinivicinus sp. A2-2]